MKERLQTWRGVAIAIAFLACWSVFAAIWPDEAAHFSIRHDPTVGAEAPLELPELFVLLGSFVAWVVIAARSRGRGPALGVSLAMVAQLVLIVGEELDWGRLLGLQLWDGPRNLRVAIRATGWLSPMLDPLAFVPVLVSYFLVPLVPLRPVRRFLAAADPVCARVPESVAAIVAVFGFALAHLALGRVVPFGILESTLYLVLASVSARVLRDRA